MSHDIHNGEPLWTSRCMHIGDIGYATAEQCRTKRRVRRDATLTYISFTRSDQFVCLLFPVAMMDSDAATDDDTAVRLHNVTLIA